MQQWKIAAIWVQAGPPLRKEDMLPILTQASAGGAWDVVFWILHKAPIRPNVVFINEMAAVAREQQELYMLGILHTYGATDTHGDGNIIHMSGSLRGFPIDAMREAVQFDADVVSEPLVWSSRHLCIGVH